MPQRSVLILIGAGIAALAAIALSVAAVLRSEKKLRAALLIAPGLIVVSLCLTYFVYAAVRPLFSF